MIVYFDDILVYNKSLNKHVNHLCFVFNVLRNEKLYTNLNNYTFCMDKVIFLSYIVSAKGIEMMKKLYECLITYKKKK